MPRIEETLGQDGCYQKGRKESLVRSKNHLKSQNFVGEELDFCQGHFPDQCTSLRVIGPLNGGVCTSVGGRVLKIATFEGSGFLGWYFSTNVKTFLGQDRFRLQGSDNC